MEDDVEVELELEKQLSLAHELFWKKKNNCKQNINKQYVVNKYSKNQVPVVLKHKLKKVP